MHFGGGCMTRRILEDCGKKILFNLTDIRSYPLMYGPRYMTESRMAFAIYESQDHITFGFKISWRMYS